MKILFVGMEGYPTAKTASVARLKAVIDCFRASNQEITVINTFSPGFVGVDERGVEVHSLQLPRRGRISWKLKSILWEIQKAIGLSRRGGIDLIHVYSQSFLWSLFYVGIGVLCRVPVVYHLVEMRSQITGQKGLWKRWNDRLLDGSFLRMFDGVIVISTRLREHVRKVAPGMPELLLPPICDFDAFKDVVPVHRERPFFVYCGSIAYLEVIDFILDAWMMSKAKDSADLVMVIGGTLTQVQVINKRCGLTNVEFLYGLEYQALLGLYKGALGLLIPLRPTEQDLARFPQKCCEYTACGGLILSTAIGEIGANFSDGCNAYLTKNYAVGEFSLLFDRVLDAPDNGKRVAQAGAAIGERIFNMRNHSNGLRDFLSTLVK